MPSNPHLAFSKDGFPVSLTSLGGADLVAISRDVTPEDAVRPLRPAVACCAAPPWCTARDARLRPSARRRPTSWCAPSSTAPLFSPRRRGAPVRRRKPRAAQPPLTRSRRPHCGQRGCHAGRRRPQPGPAEGHAAVQGGERHRLLVLPRAHDQHPGAQRAPGFSAAVGHRACYDAAGGSLAQALTRAARPPAAAKAGGPSHAEKGAHLVRRRAPADRCAARLRLRCSRGAAATDARAAPRAQCCVPSWRMQTSRRRWAASARRLS